MTRGSILGTVIVDSASAGVRVGDGHLVLTGDRLGTDTVGGHHGMDTAGDLPGMHTIIGDRVLTIIIGDTLITMVVEVTTGVAIITPIDDLQTERPTIADILPVHQ